MASIENLKISPATNTVNPEIKIEARLKIFNENELPISFSGGLFDENEIRFASLCNWETDSKVRPPISINRNGSNNAIIMDFYFSLTQEALGYIEKIRDQDKNKDIKVRLKLTVGTVSSRILGPNIHIENQNNGKDYLYLKDRSNKSSGDIKILAAQSNGEVLELLYQNLGKWFTITSSDWTQKFCPVLGIGRFATVDLFIPELENADTELDKYLNDAIQTVGRMEKYVHAGEWTNVIEESRKLAEVIRKKNNKLIDDWKDLLRQSGYQDDALNKFYKMLENFFQFSSKFVHRIDFDKNLRDQVKVEKEDAYFIYASAVGLVNLLSRKVQEFKKHNN